jgi:hypothetical protein
MSREQDLDLQLQNQREAARKIDEARREQVRLHAELQEFGQDAYFGSPKLRAINDELRVRRLEVEIYNEESGLEHYGGNKSRERHLTALEVRKGIIEDKMNDKRVWLGGYDPALTRLQEIVKPLADAYYTTAVFQNSRWSDSRSGIVTRLDEQVKEGMKRPAPNQQPQPPTEK